MSRLLNFVGIAALFVGLALTAWIWVPALWLADRLAEKSQRIDVMPSRIYW